MALIAHTGPDGEVLESEVLGASICPTCFECRGALEARGFDPGRYEQRCSCQRSEGPQERWPGWDFNTYLELCRCCGIEPIPSGSRWSVFFCEECKKRVVELNRSFGQWVIPIGRHSAMHGDVVGGDEAAIAEHVEHFALRLGILFSAGEHLQTHARACVRDNLEALGFPAGEEVDVDLYLKRARLRRLDKKAYFVDLRARFVEPRDARAARDA